MSYIVLIADREYIGTKWFRCLIDNEIDFIIILKSGTYKNAVNQSAGRSYEQLRRKVKRSKIASKVLGKSFVLEGMPLSFVVLKNRKRDADEPLVYLVTSMKGPCRLVADRYGMRWKIETLRSAAHIFEVH